MADKSTYDPDAAAIYPGKYHPIERNIELLKQISKRGIKIRRPRANIIELPDHYKVEIPAPGFKREDFSIKTHGCSILVNAIKEPDYAGSGEGFHVHGHELDSIKKTIYMPINVDTDYGTAEYNNGMLYIYFSKSCCPVKNLPGNIIVY